MYTGPLVVPLHPEWFKRPASMHALDCEDEVSLPILMPHGSTTRLRMQYSA